MSDFSRSRRPGFLCFFSPRFYKFHSCRLHPHAPMSALGDPQTLLLGTLLSCLTILIYDWICTLDQEITYVWSRPLSTGTVLFALNRYSPFIDISAAVSASLEHLSSEQCLTRYTIYSWFSIVGIFLSEVILMLRTWALWGRRRSLLIGLIILAICTLIPIIVITELEIKSLIDISPFGLAGCSWLGNAKSIIIFSYVLIMILESTIVILTALKAYRDLRYSRLPWLVQLYRDGMLFYVYLLMISLANVLVIALAPPLFSWLFSPQRVLHSVLCTRVLFHIRRTLFRESIVDLGFDDSHGPADAITFPQ
ncbi:hypothetical protein MSAN_01118000 [Mycena sanguinolenta]|uniref:DUF6533 domain-containing protein n=1 Tax=Mycena sanguinolenta TaxID=230812 RepID=A0A8H7D6R1_9AGAR|nr:hypothetical protein MSAN_01118000 [Mycena sanguinolenta]